jgi:hypothetical protein
MAILVPVGVPPIAGSIPVPVIQLAVVIAPLAEYA